MSALGLEPLLAGNGERLLLTLGLGAARTVPVAWLVPAFGGQNVPAQVRLGIGLGLSVLCLPRLFGLVPGPLGAWVWGMLLAREVAVGLTIGYVGMLLFRAAEAAGRLTDVVRGANLAEVLSPVSEGRTSPLADVNLLVATLVFLELGGPGYLASALARSYDVVPLVPTALPSQLAAVGRFVLVASGGLLEAAVGLAAPALVALLLADVALGLVARAAPQVPIYFVGMPLKAMAGVGVTLVSLGALSAALVDGFGGWRTLVEQLIAAWS